MQKYMKNKSEFKKYIYWVLGTGIAVALVISILVIVIDPFFHYHAPLQGFPYQVDNQLSQNPGMAKHMDYDSAILGSSMTVNFNTNWFREEMGLNTIKLSYSGAYPKDISNIMGIILDYHPETQCIFLGLDIINYSADINEIKYPYPEYLYDKNPFNDIKYLLNKDVLLEYILRPIADPEPSDLATIYSSWWTDEYYNTQWVMHNYEAPEPVMVEAPKDYYAEGITRNMEVNILPYIEAHPETEFVIFYPPYSILFWNDMITQNQLEATLYEYEIISDMLLKYPNVRVFFFADEEEIITNLDNYADYTHYHPDFNHFMTECFADGTDEVHNKEEATVHINHMRDIATSFDYSELLDKEW